MKKSPEQNRYNCWNHAQEEKLDNNFFPFSLFRTTGTPSPMSPTPSPSGSIGSVGSVGSIGSNEAMTTPSRNGSRPSSNCMTSPVNISIPQKIHTMTVQHLSFTNHMLFGYDLWEQSQMIFNEHRGNSSQRL